MSAPREVPKAQHDGDRVTVAVSGSRQAASEALAEYVHALQDIPPRARFRARHATDMIAGAVMIVMAGARGWLGTWWGACLLAIGVVLIVEPFAVLWRAERRTTRALWRVLIARANPALILVPQRMMCTIEHDHSAGAKPPETLN